MRRAHYLLAGLVLLAAAGFFVFELGVIREERAERRSALVEFDAKIVRLANVIGFDGMIHSFKNCVLRPAEPDYCSQVRVSGNEAERLIDEVERLAGFLGNEVKLTDTRAMVTAYSQRSLTVEAMHAEGASILEIDERVRFNDAPAAAEIEQANRIVADATAALVGRSLTNERTLAIVGVVVSLAAIGMFVLFARRRMKEHEALALAASAQKLQFTGERLAETNRALEQFASFAAHDLRAPLREVSVMTHKLRQDLLDTPAQVETCDDILRSTLEMEKLVEGLLAFSETGYRSPNKQMLEGNSLLQELLHEMAPHSGGAAIGLQKNPVDVPFLGDGMLLKQAFSNIIQNSLKYVAKDQSPRVMLTCEDHDRTIRFGFADWGTGIPEDQRESIFEPLNRLKSDTDDAEPHGIGLALVQIVVRAHGGRVWVDPEYSSGTKIWIELPKE